MRLLLALLLGLSCASMHRAAPLSAAVGEALPLEELVTRADEIAWVRAVSAESRYEGRQIVTEIVLERVETVRGGAATEQVRLLVPGGVVGEVGMKVEGAPRIPVGADAVLFAQRRGPRLRAVGMSQGVFPVAQVDGNPWVFPGGEGLALYAREPGSGQLARAQAAMSAPMPLEDFLEVIRALAATR